MAVPVPDVEAAVISLTDQMTQTVARSGAVGTAGAPPALDLVLAEQPGSRRRKDLGTSGRSGATILLELAAAAGRNRFP